VTGPQGLFHENLSKFLFSSVFSTYIDYKNQDSPPIKISAKKALIASFLNAMLLNYSSDSQICMHQV